MGNGCEFGMGENQVRTSSGVLVVSEQVCDCQSVKQDSTEAERHVTEHNWQPGWALSQSALSWSIMCSSTFPLTLQNRITDIYQFYSTRMMLSLFIAAE